MKKPIEEIQNLYFSPLLELIGKANQIHHQHHEPGKIQICKLISIKTGGCPEDCKYCAQSSRYQTAVSAEPLMQFRDVLNDAKKAIDQGATRICLGAAWRNVRDSKQFDEVLQMVTGINNLGAEVCCTLGMINEAQALKLKKAGLYAYNHNLDTSEKQYSKVVTTRTYQDRLNTLKIAQQTGLSVCCGGILGMGESIQDRLELLQTLIEVNPDSIPINRLTPIEGTPFENQKPVSIWELLRIIATTRCLIPKAMIRLSAGRSDMSLQEQALSFLAGANSIHVGEKLLTVQNTPWDQDEEMLTLLTKRGEFPNPPQTQSTH